MNFKKYQHIERWGSDEVDDINIGTCYVFPKIDGTNASVWLDSDKICAGSRRRELSAEEDNHGFYEWVNGDSAEAGAVRYFMFGYPDLRLFGEWLVPHSLKSYREDAWRRFWVFDVCRDSEDGLEYISFDEYKPLLEDAGVDFIYPLAVVKNGSYENFISWLDKNDFLIESGGGTGEGIVLKNYDYRNKYGRQTWAKIVTSEFKETHRREMGATEVQGKAMVEELMVDEFLTAAMVEKTLDRIKADSGGWNSRMIPQLLGRVFHDFVVEETWNAVKKYKNPKIDFKTLQRFVILRVKDMRPEIF